MRPEEVAKRLDNRAGYELITYKEVGLPIFGIQATGLLLERQERSCIEEFTLRAIAAGLDTSAQIQGILGLPANIVDTSLADLARQEAIRTTTHSETVLLTEHGKQLVTESELLCPSEQTIWFPFDGLLRKPKWFGNAVLLEPSDAKELGLPQIKANPLRGPEVHELSSPDVSEVVRLSTGSKAAERQVLRVLTIERRAHRFLPAIALVYRALQGNDTQIGFAIDGRISQEHELAFSSGGGLKRQQLFEGLDEAPSAPPRGEWISGRVEKLMEAAEAQRQKSARVTTARAAVDKAALAGVTARSAAERERSSADQTRAGKELANAEAELRNTSVRPLPVYEHPPALDDALGTATHRILIISPWIRRAVVDDKFLRSIRRACERGVRVSIGFGLGDEDPGEKAWDLEARRKLEKMAEELPLLEVRRLGDTHAKILVKDSEFFVITSFNWLSFRGDTSRPFREEWGTIVRDPSVVDEFYADMAKRFVAPPK
jgi:hypothetical protein